MLPLNCHDLIFNFLFSVVILQKWENNPGQALTIIEEIAIAKPTGSAWAGDKSVLRYLLFSGCEVV